MIKKTIAILSAFATVFAFAACGKLEKNEATTALGNAPTLPADINVTELYVEVDGETRPAETKVDESGSVYYEYDDGKGNKVTQSNSDNVIGITKYSEEDIKEMENQVKEFEEQLKDMEENPENYTEPKVDMVLNEGLVPDDKLNQKEDVTLGTNGKPVRDYTKQVQKIFEGDNFTFRVNVVSITNGAETRMPISWYKSGNNMLMEASMPIFSNTPTKIGMLIKDGKGYMIIPSMKAYTEIPKEMFGEMFDPEMFEQAFEGAEAESSNKYISSYDVELNGKKYVCDVYEDSYGATNKYYFDANGVIVRSESITGDTFTIMEMIEISDKCDPAVLTIPKKYKNMSFLGSMFQ